MNNIWLLEVWLAMLLVFLNKTTARERTRIDAEIISHLSEDDSSTEENGYPQDDENYYDDSINPQIIYISNEQKDTDNSVKYFLNLKEMLDKISKLNDTDDKKERIEKLLISYNLNNTKIHYEHTVIDIDPFQAEKKNQSSKQLG